MTKDSEDSSKAGEDVSGRKSIDGDECSHEDHEEEEEYDDEHEENDGKAKSEGEAEVTGNAEDVDGEGTALALSDRSLLTAKPLAIHVSSTLNDGAQKDSKVFNGNESFYVVLRLH